jgi:hypothetical protein
MPRDGERRKSRGGVKEERSVKKLAAVVAILGLVATAVFVVPALETDSSQVFSRVGIADGDGGE